MSSQKIKPCPTRDWVNCPICDSPDSEQTCDREGNKLIYCTNHACLSNGGTYQKENRRPSPWRPIAEAPRDGTWILAIVYSSKLSGSIYWIIHWSELWKDWADCEFCYNPTHFMPLPSPPKDGGNL